MKRTTLLVVLLAALLAFAPSLSAPFIQDDEGVIVHNRDLRADRLLELAGPAYWDRELPFDDPWRPGHQLYRPLPVMMFALEKAVWGLNAAWFRMVNLLIHALVSVCVALLAFRFSGERRAGVLCGVLFAVHAVHFEPVVHIVGRAELGMTLATLAALVAAPGAARSRRGFLLVLALSVAAPLFKEQGLLCPLALLVYVHSARLWPRRLAVLYSAAAALWTGVFLVLRSVAIGGYRPAPDLQPLLPYSYLERAAVMSAALLEYCRLLIFPTDSLLDYTHLERFSDAAFLPLAGLLVAAATAALFVFGLRRRRPGVALGAGLIILGLGPVSNVLVPVGSVMAERFLYLPSAGLCLLAAVLLARRPQSRLLPAFAGGAILFMLLQCWRNTYYFMSPPRLARRIVTVHGDKPRHLHIAAVMLEASGRPAEAREAWRRQKELEPENPAPDIHLAWLNLKEYEQASTPARAALAAKLDLDLVRLQPLGNPKVSRSAPLTRGLIHYLKEDYDAARLEFLTAALEGHTGSHRRLAARSLLQMEHSGLGSTRLSPRLRRELEALLAGPGKKGTVPFHF